MAQRGEQTTDRIRDELKCPSCAYSLRGLPGDRITCPECGQAVNVAQLTAAQWRGPWFRAPLLNTLALPVAWALLAPMASLLGLILLAGYRIDAPPPWLILALFMLNAIGWAALLALAIRRFGGPEALWLSLLLHVTLIAYAMGIIGMLSMLVGVLFNVSSSMPAAIGNFLGFLVFVAVVVGARLMERFVAYRCIRRYLRLRAAGGTMPE